MDILYIGSDDAAYESEIYAKKNNMSFEKMQIKNFEALTEIKKEIMARSPQHLFLDISSMISSIDEADLIEFIRIITITINTNIVIIAIGMNYQMAIVKSLILSGVSNFVFTANLTKQYKEISAAVNNRSSITQEDVDKIANNREAEIERVLDVLPEVEFSETTTKLKKKIAVVGSMERIGTTTVAMQLIKFLESQGKRSCYIERNFTGYVDDLQIYYTDFKIGEKGLVKYNNIDMFNKPEYVSQVLHGEHEYYIYDFGSIDKSDFVSILDQDVIIAVCGIAPAEMKSFSKLYKKMREHTNVLYLFNMVHPNEREDVLAMQGEKRNNSFFMEYSPDPFTYNPANEEAFKKILDISPSAVLHKTKKRKRGFFK